MQSSLSVRVGGRVSSRRSAGFTLVELLVVIGIIGLLLSILLPSLNRARGAARELACLSNLRQLGIGMGMYLANSKGVFPPHKVSLTSVAALPAGPVLARAFAPSATPLVATDAFWGDLLMPYLKSKEIFQCPDMIGQIKVDDATVWQFNYDAMHICYGYNAYFLGHYPYNAAAPEYGYTPFIKPRNWVKISQVRSPTTVMMFADKAPPFPFSMWWPHAQEVVTTTVRTDANEGLAGTRHRGRGCIVFVDGHCEARLPKEVNPRFQTATIADKTNIKYWDPAQAP